MGIVAYRIVQIHRCYYFASHRTVEKHHQEATRALNDRLSGEREAREQAAQALSETSLKAQALHEQLCKARTELAQANQVSD